MKFKEILKRVQKNLIVLLIAFCAAVKKIYLFVVNLLYNSILYCTNLFLDFLPAFSFNRNKLIGIAKKHYYKYNPKERLRIAKNSFFLYAFKNIKSPWGFIHIFVIVFIPTLSLIYISKCFDTFIADYLKYIEIINIIDGRINTIATLTSVFIAVIIFILNTFKVEGKELYRTVFFESYMYPSLYFMLLTLVYILSINYFHYNFDINNTLFNLKALIILTYFSYFLIIFSIISIGFMLVRLYYLANTGILISKYDKNIEASIMKANYEDTINALSTLILKKELQRMGFTYEFYDTLIPKKIFAPVYYSNSGFLSDVKLNRLENIIKKYKTSFLGYFNSVTIGKEVTNNDIIFWINPLLNDNIIKKVSKSFRISLYD
jgi:hypothetical protein